MSGPRKTTAPAPKLPAPFPWFGGKARVAHEVWERFGVVKQYIEPFAGSLAVYLACPYEIKAVLVNDIDCFVANFWRAVSADADAVARHADYPVHEVDVQARARWLMARDDFRERMRTDPDFYDAKIAGWWCWGQSASIPGNWMTRSAWTSTFHRHPRPHGVLAKDGVARIASLSAKLLGVKTLCGDWSRTVSCPAYLRAATPCAIFLDPPYARGRAECYVEDSYDVSAIVRAWAISNGEDADLRIALCGFEGEHEMPASWERLAWKTAGGMSKIHGARVVVGQGKANVRRERIWFSPTCQRPRERSLW